MNEFNPVLLQEEFKGIGIFDEKPQVMPNTVRVYLSAERSTIFSSGSNITRSELMAGHYSTVYVIDLREFQKIYDQALGSSDDLGGFTARINLSLRISKPDVFTRAMIKDVIKFIQQKLTPYLENISMNYSPEKSLALQKDFLMQLENTPFQTNMDREHGILVYVESILIKPDTKALELIQQSRRQQEEREQAIKKMEENFTLQMAQQKNEAEIQLAEMTHRFEIKSRETALNMENRKGNGQNIVYSNATAKPLSPGNSLSLPHEEDLGVSLLNPKDNEGEASL